MFAISMVLEFVSNYFTYAFKLKATLALMCRNTSSADQVAGNSDNKSAFSMHLSLEAFIRYDRRGYDTNPSLSSCGYGGA